MPIITINGVPGTIFIEKGEMLRGAVQSVVSQVEKLHLKPEDITVHAPLDLCASTKPDELELTITVTGLIYKHERGGKVREVLQSKLVKTLRTLFLSARLIECLPIEFTRRGEILASRRR
ncbi:MAG: hypothetical protein V4664_00310 [Patescibacteria group bacterium]